MKIATYAPKGSNKTLSDFTPHVMSKRNKLLNPWFQGFFRCTFPLEIKLNKVKLITQEGSYIFDHALWKHVLGKSLAVAMDSW